jgi:6-phosphogluconate dehydrogenase (decarboxylating)
MKAAYAVLGKMGLNMVERLLEQGPRAVAFDRDRKSAEDIEKKERSVPILLPRSRSR